MDEINRKQRQRFMLLSHLYDKSGASQEARFCARDLATELGIERSQAVDIAEFLAHEGLVKFWVDQPLIGITHSGIKEVERARTHPDEPTEHFRPLHVIFVNQMIGSQIQQGTSDSRQTGTFTTNTINVDEAKQFIQNLKHQLTALGLSQDDEAELLSEINSIEPLLNSPKPREPRIRNGLEAIRAVIVSASGAVASHEIIRAIDALLS